MEEVYNRVAIERKLRGLSQQQLADAIGVSRKTISTIETRRLRLNSGCVKNSRLFCGSCGINFLTRTGNR